MAAQVKVDRDEFARLAREGWTNEELRARFDCNAATVSRLRRHLGVPSPRWARMTPERLARIEALLDDGWSFAEVRRAEHVDHDTLRRYFPGRQWSEEHRLDMLTASRMWDQVRTATYAARLTTPGTFAY